jgi:hypothetical protein
MMKRRILKHKDVGKKFNVINFRRRWNGCGSW